jgi:hypothetical protein
VDEQRWNEKCLGLEKKSHAAEVLLFSVVDAVNSTAQRTGGPSTPHLRFSLVRATSRIPGGLSSFLQFDPYGLRFGDVEIFLFFLFLLQTQLRWAASGNLRAWQHEPSHCCCCMQLKSSTTPLNSTACTLP